MAATEPLRVCHHSERRGDLQLLTDDLFGAALKILEAKERRSRQPPERCYRPIHGPAMSENFAYPHAMI